MLSGHRNILENVRLYSFVLISCAKYEPKIGESLDDCIVCINSFRVQTKLLFSKYGNL